MNAQTKSRLSPLESLRAAADYAEGIDAEDLIGISLDRIDGDDRARIHVMNRAMPHRVLPTVKSGPVSTRYEVDMGGFVVFSLVFKEA